MRRVLIITHYFTPREGIGSVRLGGIAKYLPEFGWHPIILTSALPYRKGGSYTLIETPAFEDTFTKWKRRIGVNPQRGFKEQIGSLENIDNKRSRLFNRFVEFCKGVLAFPDSTRNWYNVACEYAAKAIQEQPVDVLLSSSSPVTTHLIAHSIKEKYKLPWVADLRDLWTQNHYYPYGILRKTIERRLELRTLSTADAIITISEPLSDKLRLLHKHNEIYSIPSGFDPDDHRKIRLTSNFTITYTGQLYEGKRDPRLFLTLVRELMGNKCIDESRVRIRFLGTKSPWLETFVKNIGMEATVTFALVDRSAALIKQAESQLLLLLNWNNPEEKGIYTGKLFEYLGAQRPIISVGGVNGVVSDLLRETHAGVFCGSDRDIIKSTLLKYYTEYAQTGSVIFQGNMSDINKYSHREMARKFGHVLSSVLN